MGLVKRYSLPPGGDGVPAPRSLGGGTPCRREGMTGYPVPLLGRRYCMPINGNVEMLAGLPQTWDRKQHPVDTKFTIVM